MPLTQLQINEFTKRATAAGLDPNQIQAEIQKKMQEMGGYNGAPPSAQQPLPQGQASTIPNQGMSSIAGSANTQPQGQGQEQDGNFISTFINGLIQPGVDALKFGGEAAYQAGKFAFDPIFRKSVMGGELTPEESKKLLSQHATLFYNDEEAQQKLGDQGKILATGAKATAGAASYAVPFGKGAGLASKVFIPGAVTGALSEASRPDATPGSVVQAGAEGAAAAGVVHGIGGMLSWAQGQGGELTRQADALQEGTRKIRTKASVYGAGQEKAINETLDKYGFTGSAQDQYAKLEPTLNGIEQQIQDFIKKNPQLSVSKDSILTEFQKNLKSSIRTGDLTKPQAQEEVKTYLTQLLEAAGEGEGGQPLKAGAAIPLATLRDMKRILNEDSKTVFNTIQNGKASLNPRQKVILAAWDSLDSAVSGIAPDVKNLLLDESNLYKAAQPLSSARSNAPTFRVMGTSVPAGITQKLRDLGSSVLKKLGLSADKLPKDTASLEKLAALTPDALKQKGLTDQEIQQVQDFSQSAAAPGATDPATAQLTSTQPSMQPDTKPTALNPFGNFTKRQVLALALSQGAKAKDLEEIGKVYDSVGGDPNAISSETQKTAASLRDEYFQRTQQTKFIDASTMYHKIMSASPTASGDIAIVYGFMKMLDPTSVVRESEFATAANSGGVDSTIINQYNKLKSGQRLTDSQRIAFKNEAARVFQTYQQRQAPIDAYYQGLAQKYGIDPSLLGVGLYK
jgi:hypothetical protein